MSPLKPLTSSPKSILFQRKTDQDKDGVGVDVEEGVPWRTRVRKVDEGTEVSTGHVGRPGVEESEIPGRDDTRSSGMP